MCLFLGTGILGIWALPATMHGASDASSSHRVRFDVEDPQPAPAVLASQETPSLTAGGGFANPLGNRRITKAGASDEVYVSYENTTTAGHVKFKADENNGPATLNFLSPRTGNVMSGVFNAWICDMGGTPNEAGATIHDYVVSVDEYLHFYAPGPNGPVHVKEVDTLQALGHIDQAVCGDFDGDGLDEVAVASSTWEPSQIFFFDDAKQGFRDMGSFTATDAWKAHGLGVTIVGAGNLAETATETPGKPMRHEIAWTVGAPRGDRMGVVSYTCEAGAPASTSCFSQVRIQRPATPDARWFVGEFDGVLSTQEVGQCVHSWTQNGEGRWTFRAWDVVGVLVRDATIPSGMFIILNDITSIACLPGDANGDGITEVFLSISSHPLGEENAYATRYRAGVFNVTGGAPEDVKLVSIVSDEFRFGTLPSVAVADLDGDGRDDLLRYFRYQNENALYQALRSQWYRMPAGGAFEVQEERHLPLEDYPHSEGISPPISFVVGDVDNDGAVLEYTGNRTRVSGHVSPLAVLAPPPLIEGADMQQDNAYSSFGQVNTQSQDRSSGFSSGTSTLFGASVETNSGGFSRSLEAEIQTESARGVSRSNSVGVVTAVHFQTGWRETAVVYSFSAYDAYEYRILRNGGVNLTKPGEYVILVPVLHSIRQASLEEFNKLVAPEARIGNETLKHVAGDPKSYPCLGRSEAARTCGLHNRADILAGIDPLAMHAELPTTQHEAGRFVQDAVSKVAIPDILGQAVDVQPYGVEENTRLQAVDWPEATIGTGGAGGMTSLTLSLSSDHTLTESTEVTGSASLKATVGFSSEAVPGAKIAGGGISASFGKGAFASVQEEYSSVVGEATEFWGSVGVLPPEDVQDVYTFGIFVYPRAHPFGWRYWVLNFYTTGFGPEYRGPAPLLEDAPEPLGPIRHARTDLTPTFSWEPLEGAKSYRVEVRDAASHDTISSNTTNVALWKLSSPLEPFRALEWRVIAVNARNGESPPSAWSPFTPVEGRLAADIEDVLVRDDGKITMSWTSPDPRGAPPGGWRYHVRILDSHGNLTQERELVGATSWTTSVLPPGHYTIKLVTRSDHSDQGEDDASVQTFGEVLPLRDAPIPISPARGEEASPTPTLTWSHLAGATQYRIVLRDRLLARNTTTVTVNNTTWNVPGPLTTDESYEWTVAGVNAKGDRGPASDTAVFVVVPPLTRAPQLAAGPPGSNGTVGIRWSPLGAEASASGREFGAPRTYTLALDDNMRFETPQLTATNQTTALTRPLTVGTWYAHVRAENGAVVGPWSSPVTIVVLNVDPTGKDGVIPDEGAFDDGSAVEVPGVSVAWLILALACAPLLVRRRRRAV